jgi:hypothetical protein
MGILAFGSLRTDRGPELEAAIVDWRPATAPFAIEHARYNETRGDAPTLVPVASAVLRILPKHASAQLVRAIWTLTAPPSNLRTCYLKPPVAEGLGSRV